MIFVTRVLEDWLEREIIQWVCQVGRSGEEGRKEMLYLTKGGRNVLFNDALNTFYLRLYGVGHMVKDHSDSER